MFNAWNVIYINSFLNGRPHPGIAEIDFLLDLEGEILPLDVKAGINPKSKSLGVYAGRYAPRILLRSTLLNLKLDGMILNVPLYAIEHIARLARNRAH
jgi:hypothetical protein